MKRLQCQEGIATAKGSGRASAMLNKVFSDHLTDLQNALGRTTQRQALLTQNLANANVPGYKRQDEDFHVALQGELKSNDLQQAQQADQAFTDGTSLRNDGNNVDVEREVTSISETDLHYQALTAITSDFFAGLKSAIREGK